MVRATLLVSKFCGVVQQKESDTSASSCVSFKSDWSMDPPLKLRVEPCSSGSGVVQQEESDTSAPSCVSFKSDQSMDPPLSAFCKQFRANLGRRFQLLSDGLQSHGQSTLLNDIYTELYITEGGTGEVNNEHEVRQIEMSTKLHQLEEDKLIKCNDIFKPLPGQHGHIRTVLTKGVAGIGKTVSVQKFILDWAEGKANQDVDFIIPLPFRELNLMKDQHFSLEGLVHCFFPELKGVRFSTIAKRRIVFIFDGLDECRLPLDFQNCSLVHDETWTTSVDGLLVNLMKKNLLPSVLIWMTTRPAAASQIPAECIDQLTEIRGFNDPQKEEYFKKKISDQNMANKIIKHLKLSRSLHIMCHIPVFCWISATVLEKMFRDAEDAAVPRTLTQMYTHFLIIQTSVREKKYPQTQHGDKEMISKLGQLAFKQLLKGNLIFYEEDLRECDINVEDAVTYSGVCTQIFREEFELLHGQGKVFCFVHLSIQEHLAALYVHLTFSEGNKSVLNQWNPTKGANTFQCSSMADLYMSAVNKALQSQNGQFDMFLRFLLGLSLETNQVLLQILLSQKSAYSSISVADTTDYIKLRLRNNLTPEKYINLFHCLNELNDFSLEEEIQRFQKSRRLSKTKLSTSQWAALVFVLLTSGSELNVFDPWKYTTDDVEECLHRMFPVLMASRAAEVSLDKLSDKGFQALAKSISSASTCIRELKLSGTPPQSGIKILSEGLKDPHCKLEILRLSGCNVTTEDFRLLVSALNSNPSHLKELDLSFCFWKDFGMLMLREFLKNPHCRLEKLKLVDCGLKSESCSDLAAALSSNSSLTDLDLSTNDLRDCGIKVLSSGLKNSSCKLRSLSLANCRITEISCQSLCTALISNPSYIRELCLNMNKFGDGGVQIISDFLEMPSCKLKKLSLSDCSITEGAAALVSALELNPSHLRELELDGNKLDASVKKKLSDLQQHEGYRLEKLK
ncbi:NACHT, LRR and PYD domains-containing protein 12-like [Trichomycterus rosablanca]|uniref:NACHT, LRR and PYD domains-containing protein 12-like n=1 Tax=Trichomycterus rosablanca TaxID=2290929 RepID=UPI002F35168C